jgi:hypothetical protein
MVHKIEDQVEYGYSRWLDEQKYEDINDYAVLFRGQIEKAGGKFVRMTKRPFGFIFRVGSLEATVAVKNQKITISAKPF